MRGDDLPIIIPVDPHIGKDVATAAILVTELAFLILVVSNNGRVSHDANFDVIQFHILDSIGTGTDVGNGFLFGVPLAIGAHAAEIISHDAIENVNVLLKD